MAIWDKEKMMFVEGRARKKKGGPKPAPGIESRRPVPGRGRGAGKKAEAKREALGALKAAGVPDDQALVMAGYSPRMKRELKSGKVLETVAQMRERLQSAKGNTLADSVDFYKKLSGDTELDAADRIRARSRMDSLLDYDATKKIEVSETRQELSVAVSFLSGSAVSPAELLRNLTSGRVAGEIEDLTGA